MIKSVTNKNNRGKKRKTIGGPITSVEFDMPGIKLPLVRIGYSTSGACHGAIKPMEKG